MMFQNLCSKMIEFFKKIKRRLFIFLAVLGPGIITAVADDDAAGVATYSLAGAKFGYSILIILIIITVLLAITQEMGTRIAVISGKGLGDLIREKYGVKISVIVFAFLFTVNLGTIIANFSGLKTALEMFRLPVVPIIILFIFISASFITKGNYRNIQNIFLIGLFFYFGYLIAAFKAQPDWSLAVGSLFFPFEVKISREFIFASIAILGTTVTPWGQFFVHSFYIDKKITPDKVKYAQLETYLGAFITDFFTFFMIVATAATLFVHRIPLQSGGEAALAIKPLAGEFAGVLFAVGLLNAAIMGILIISLTTAYVFAEFFGYEGSLDASFKRGKIFYGIFIVQIIIAGTIVLLPSISLFKIVFYTQSLNGILLPAVIYFLLRFINDKEIMGQYTNNKFYNYFAIISSVVIITATFFTLITALFNLVVV